MKKLLEYIIKWFTGGITYFYMEILFRGYSHISMIVCGGICYVLTAEAGSHILRLRTNIYVRLALIMLAGSILITGTELITGLIVNVKMKLNVWDYSDMPYNYKGQICLAFSLIWSIISLVCVYIYNVIDRFVLHYNKVEN